MNKHFLIPTCLIVSMSLFTCCSNQKSDVEAQKLVDKQAELVKEGQEEIEDFLGEMSTIKDSMAITQKKLADARQLVAREMKSLEKEKVIMEMNKEKENLGRLLRKKDSLSQSLEYNITMERRIFDQIERLEDLEDSLINTNEVISGIIKGSETSYEDDISHINQQLSNIERQQISTQRSINLNQKKIEVAKRKVQLFQDEMLVLEEEKNYQLRTGVSNEQIAEIEREIKALEKQITSSLEKIESSQKNITSNKGRLTELDQQEESLQKEFKTYYETKGVVTQFAEAEKQRTQQKVADLHEKTEILTTDKVNIWESKQLLEQKLYEIEKQISELETARLPELNKKVAEIELRVPDQGKTPSKYASELDSLNAALAKSGEKFEQETEILSLEQQLLTTQTEQSQKDLSKNTKKTVIIFSTIILIFLLMFYFIGRVRKGKLSKSS